VNFQDIKKIYAEKHPPSLLFSSVQSKKALDKILTQHLIWYQQKNIYYETCLEEEEASHWKSNGD